MTLENTGTVALSDINLVNDFGSQFGNAFIDSVDLSITNYTASALPLEMGIGGLLLPNQFITVQAIIEVDASMIENPTDNIAIAYGLSEDSIAVEDASNDGFVPSSGSGGFVNPTPVNLPGQLYSTKKLSELEHALVPGEVYATYEVVVTNIGNQELTNLNIQQDFLSQFGSGFGGVISMPSIDTISVSQPPSLNSAFSGAGLGTNIFTGNDGLLKPDESFKVLYKIKVNLSALPYNAASQAEASALDEQSNFVYDKSDNDALNNQDDPTVNDDTPTYFPQISIVEVKNNSVLTGSSVGDEIYF